MSKYGLKREEAFRVMLTKTKQKTTIILTSIIVLVVYSVHVVDTSLAILGQTWAVRAERRASPILG